MQKSLSAPITFFFAFPPLSASSAQVPPALAGSSLTGSGNWIRHFTGLPFRKIVYPALNRFTDIAVFKKDMPHCRQTPPSSAAAYIPVSYKQLPDLNTCDMSGRELFTFDSAAKCMLHNKLRSAANKAP